MKAYRVSVCKGPDCRKGGADAVFQAAQDAVAGSDFQGRCVLYRGGCYGLCHLGPNVVVRQDVGRPRDLLSKEDFQLMGWPEETYYWAMTPQGMVRVLREHVGGGQPVAECLGDPTREPEPAK